METVQKPVMIVGVDDSDHSFYALEWTLDHFLTPSAPFKLIVVHSKPTPTSAIGFAGPGAADVFPVVDSDLKKIAARVVEKAKDLCHSKSVDDVIFEIVEGDARNVLCEAVERHHATILVVGSHGYGAIKRFISQLILFDYYHVLLNNIDFSRAVLGSVSDYVTHHAHCTVMVVKKPKTKH